MANELKSETKAQVVSLLCEGNTPARNAPSRRVATSAACPIRLPNLNATPEPL